MEIFLVPADADQVDRALASLKSVTNRPVWMDGTDAVNWETALAEALAAYPIDVVESACVAWRLVPNHGKWWPTEQDLRAQCENIYRPRKSLFNKARLLLQDLRIREAEANRANDPSYFAGEVHRQFKARMAERLLHDQMRAYFNPGHIRFVGVSEVHVRTLIAQAIFDRYGADIMEELGVVVRHVPEDFLRERDLKTDPTPEEDAEVSRKMTRLNEAVAKGESIEALRRSGEL